MEFTAEDFKNIREGLRSGEGFKIYCSCVALKHFQEKKDKFIDLDERNKITDLLFHTLQKPKMQDDNFHKIAWNSYFIFSFKQWLELKENIKAL